MPFFKNVANKWRKRNAPQDAPRGSVRPRNKLPIFHVLYWEHADLHFEEPLTLEDALEGRRPHKGPCLCQECDGIVESWRSRLDALHASFRMTAKEGKGFREEVKDFVCLSPGKAIEWNVQRFRAYSQEQRKKVLTEQTVLQPPFLVEQGRVRPAEAGVTVRNLAKGDAHSKEEALRDWLRSYALRMKSLAAAQDGVSALVEIQQDGVEVSYFGCQQPFFAQDPERPIAHVVLLVAGPQGFRPGDLQLIEDSLLSNSSGCQVGPLRLSLPSWARANAALGDLFMQHDRQELVPVLEDLRLVGQDAYAEFSDLWRRAMLAIGHFEGTMSEKLELLERLKAVWQPTSEQPNEELTVALAKAQVAKLVEAGLLLPLAEAPWHARRWVNAAEPAALVSALDQLEEAGNLSWQDLVERLEEAPAPRDGHTPDALAVALAPLAVPEILWELPCSIGIELIKDFKEKSWDIELLEANALRKLGRDDPKASTNVAPKQPNHPPPPWLAKNLKQAEADAVEDFIYRNHVDQAAAQGLRDLSEELQKEVMNTDMSHCRNPSAVVYSRIKQVRAGSKTLSSWPSSSWEQSEDEDQPEEPLSQEGDFQPGRLEGWIKSVGKDFGFITSEKVASERDVYVQRNEIDRLMKEHRLWSVRFLVQKRVSFELSYTNKGAGRPRAEELVLEDLEYCNDQRSKDDQEMASKKEEEKDEESEEDWLFKDEGLAEEEAPGEDAIPAEDELRDEGSAAASPQEGPAPVAKARPSLPKIQLRAKAKPKAQAKEEAEDEDENEVQDISRQSSLEAAEENPAEDSQPDWQHKNNWGRGWKSGWKDSWWSRGWKDDEEVEHGKWSASSWRSDSQDSDAAPWSLRSAQWQRPAEQSSHDQQELPVQPAEEEAEKQQLPSEADHAQYMDFHDSQQGNEEFVQPEQQESQHHEQYESPREQPHLQPATHDPEAAQDDAQLLQARQPLPPQENLFEEHKQRSKRPLPLPRPSATEPQRPKVKLPRPKAKNEEPSLPARPSKSRDRRRSSRTHSRRKKRRSRSRSRRRSSRRRRSSSTSRSRSRSRRKEEKAKEDKAKTTPPETKTLPLEKEILDKAKAKADDAWDFWGASSVEGTSKEVVKPAPFGVPPPPPELPPSEASVPPPPPEAPAAEADKVQEAAPPPPAPPQVGEAPTAPVQGDLQALQQAQLSAQQQLQQHVWQLQQNQQHQQNLAHLQQYSMMLPAAQGVAMQYQVVKQQEVMLQQQHMVQQQQIQQQPVAQVQDAQLASVLWSQLRNHDISNLVNNAQQ